jgi:CHRD domain-containing protein
MKRFTIGAMVLAAGLAAATCGGSSSTPTGPSNTGPIIFTAQLSALNEFPALASTNAEIGARGNATITFRVGRDPATGAVNGGGTVDWSVQLNSFPPGTAAVNAHIHPGAAGVAGGVLLGVSGLSPAAPVLMGDGTATLTFTNTTITQDIATQVVANPAGFYFNVHTPTNPGGAVRGQLVRTP